MGRKQRGIYGGRKMSNTHSTVMPEAAKIVVKAKALIVVTKVVTGDIVSVRPGGVRRLKFLPLRAGVKVVVRGSNSQQDIYLYTKDVSAVQQELVTYWDTEVIR